MLLRPAPVNFHFGRLPWLGAQISPGRRFLPERGNARSSARIDCGRIS